MDEVRRVAAGETDIVTSTTYPTSCTATCASPLTTTDARGNVTNYTYNATHGGVTSITLPAPSAGAARPRTDFTYGQLYARYRNSAGTIVNAPSPVWKATLTESCITGTSCEGTANEVETAIVYGTGTSAATNLLPSAVTTRAGNNTPSATTSYAYDPFANVATIDGPLANEYDSVHYRYNEGIQLEGMIGPDPDSLAPGEGQRRRAERYTYDDNGNVIQADFGRVNSTSDSAWSNFTVSHSQYISYDVVARPVSVELRVGTARYSHIDTSYDEGSRVTCATVRMNPAQFATQPDACALDTAGSFGPDRITRHYYDGASRLTEARDGFGTSAVATRWIRTFTDNGQVATVADGGANLTTYIYDGHDRLEELRYPDADNGAVSSTTDKEVYTYDAASNVTRRRLRDGTDYIDFAYDALNRRTLMNPSAGNTPNVSYTYDNLGRMLTATQTGHALTFAYDALGRLVREQGPLGAVTSEYRIDGARSAIGYPGGVSFHYGYHWNGAPISIFEGSDTGPRIANFGYDALNRPTELRWGQSGEPGVTAVQAISYDPVSRISSIANTLPAAAVPGSVTIGLTGYNPASQITTRTRDDPAYAFDQGAPGTTSYTPNGLNQYDAVNPPGAATAVLDYDGRGNLIRYDETGTVNDRTYAYDGLNRMTSATVGGQTTTFTYDPLGRLHSIDGPVEDQRLLWDGDRIIAEYAGFTGSVVRRRFVHAPGSLGAPLVIYLEDGVGLANRQYVQTDERGSVIAMVNADDGTQLTANKYGPFGERGPSGGGPYRYAGQLWIREAALSYMRNRMYDPELGRFLQSDPIGYSGGMNLYAYVGNDPTNRVDPWGLSGKCSPSVGNEIVVCYQRDGPPGTMTYYYDPTGSPSLDGGGSGEIGGGGGGGDVGAAEEEDEEQCQFTSGLRTGLEEAMLGGAQLTADAIDAGDPAREYGTLGQTNEQGVTVQPATAGPRVINTPRAGPRQVASWSGRGSPGQGYVSIWIHGGRASWHRGGMLSGAGSMGPDVATASTLRSAAPGGQFWAVLIVGNNFYAWGPDARLDKPGEIIGSDQCGDE